MSIEAAEHGNTTHPATGRIGGALVALILLLTLVSPVLASPGRRDGEERGRGRLVLPPALEDSDFFSAGPEADEKVELGRVLMFDKVLSGNANIACATCHHPSMGTGDGLALPVGEGGFGLGTVRDTNEGDMAHVEGRVPRNAPPVYNLAAHEFQALFHDGGE